MSLDREETVRMWYIALLVGLVVSTFGSQLGDLLCYPEEDQWNATRPSHERFETSCRSFGIVRIPIEGFGELQNWSPEQKLEATTNIFTVFGGISECLCMALIVPFVIYKLLTWKMRQGRINPLFNAAKAVQLALAANQQSLYDHRVGVLINFLRFHPGNFFTRNIMCMVVLWWNLLFPIWTLAIVYIITSHFDLPLVWLDPVESYRSDFEWASLEGTWFPKNVACYIMTADIGQGILDHSFCTLPGNELLSRNLKRICWMMMLYNLFAFMRCLDVIDTYWIPQGRQALIESWLELEGEEKICEKTFKAFVRQFSADDLMTLSMIDRCLGRETIMHIIACYYEVFYVNQQLNKKVV